MMPEKFITLPWQELERYGPYVTQGGQVVDNPPKGTVLEEGLVDIKASVLYEVAARYLDDYVSGTTPPFVSHQAKLALVQAGLAKEETRGGIHGTLALLGLLETLDRG